MTGPSISRLVSAALVGGVASVALATPAAAMVDPAPPPNPGGQVLSEVGGAVDETAWLELGLGVLGGLALAGAGVAASASLRHRMAAHPA
jgi:hypothetical protein